MMASIVNKTVILILFLLLTAGMFFCDFNKNTEREIPLPYPDSTMAKFYQSRVDSNEYVWFLDAKDAATSFVNEYRMVKDGFSATDAILVGEGIFHATVEIELSDKILVLELERPFKHLGRKSIWQVVAMKEKPWPKK